MNKEQIEAWAKETAVEGRLLARDELEEVLMIAGEKLLKRVVYEPVGDRGSVYRRMSHG